VKRFLCLLVVGVVVTGAVRVGAGQLGAQMPSNCVAHISFDGGVDLVDDYRCAGLAIEFHTAGVAYSPGPIWAGQWLFVDETGQFRVGSCTFNRGIHPTIDVPSAVVAQTFPNDPTGARVAYLTWRYGDTTDNLTAAAMWALLHYYAQDGAGTRRAVNGAAPLVPSLAMIGRASGRDDIQALAIALDSEAARYAGDWVIAANVDTDGNIEVALSAAGQPVADAAINLLMSGQDEPVTVRTDAAGSAHATMSVVPGTITVVATASSPGSALVYRGTPAGPDPQGAQNLVTGGAPVAISATATVDLPLPPTTTSTTTSTSTTTTTLPPETTTTSTTTLPPETSTTTTTLPAETTTTSTSSTTTLPPETTTTSSTTTTVAAVEVEAVPPPPSPPDTSAPPLPKTGKGSDLVSFLATALLVAGIGIVGVASRRPPRTVIYTRRHDSRGSPRARRALPRSSA
jgi:hypothetical protein